MLLFASPAQWLSSFRSWSIQRESKKTRKSLTPAIPFCSFVMKTQSEHKSNATWKNKDATLWLKRANLYSYLFILIQRRRCSLSNTWLAWPPPGGYRKLESWPMVPYWGHHRMCRFFVSTTTTTTTTKAPNVGKWWTWIIERRQEQSRTAQHQAICRRRSSMQTVSFPMEGGGAR